MAYKKFKSSGFSKSTDRPPDIRFAPRPEVKGKKSKVGKVMAEFKKQTLHSGSKKGPVVKSRKQAIAIGLNQARKAMERKRGN